MSSRDKLFDDPLLGLSPSLPPMPVSRAALTSPTSKELQVDDPLLGLLSTQSIKSTSAEKSKSIASPSAQAEETLSTIDMDKVKLKVAKEKKLNVVTTSNPTGSDQQQKSVPDSRLGLGVDLFGNMSSSRGTKESVFDDILTTRRSSEDSSGLFSTATATGKTVEDMMRSVAVNPNASKFRVAYETDDAKIEDLKVGKLVETEELDFGLFGKASGALRSGHEGRDQLQKSSIGIMSTKSEEFDMNLSADYLNELDSATSGKDLSVRPQMPASTFELKSPPTTAEPAIDLSSLNLDDYIAQQTSDKTGGGLFD
jgi:hypothetical protein